MSDSYAWFLLPLVVQIGRSSAVSVREEGQVLWEAPNGLDAPALFCRHCRKSM